ncbi:hypothetical protein [Sphingobacterium sp. LRF_L2]|uniref:hypothetical protein n=1 Tax=Sphingobacterium sp. LRF_L2 TaxID=3369421 RepID=UPI003F616B34
MKLYLLTFSVCPKLIARRIEMTEYLSKHVSNLQLVSVELQDGISAMSFIAKGRVEELILNLLRLKGFNLSFMQAKQIDPK